MTLNDLIAQLLPDPAAQAKLRDAIGKSGGNLAFSLATVIPPGTDLSKYAFVAGTPGNPTQYVAAPAPAAYTCTPTFALSVSYINIAAANNPLAFPAVAGAGTGIELRGDGISITGFVVTSAPPGMTVTRTSGTDCVTDFTINVPVGLPVKVEPSGDRGTHRFACAVTTGGQGGYVVGAQDVTFQGCVHPGSLGEDCIRFSADNPVAQGGTGKRPARCKVVHSDLTVLPNQVGSKQSSTISFRDCDESCEASDNKLRGNVRAGQDTKTPTAIGLKFNRNHCYPDPHGIDMLVLIAATMQECDGNIFECTSAIRPIGGTAGVSKSCVPTNNTMKMTPTGASRKKLFIWNNGTGETDGTGLVVK